MTALEAGSETARAEFEKLPAEQQKAVVEATNPELLGSPDIGSVIRNPTARKWIYGVYAILALLVGATVAGFQAVATILPTWVEITQAVIAYLAIPVGGLAAVNTNTGQK